MTSLDTLFALVDSDTQELWTTRLFSIAATYGFSHVLFGIAPTKPVSLDQALIISNYPKEWRLLYDANSLHLVDPTFTHCFKSSLPIIWSSDTFSTLDQRLFYEKASRFGLHCGISYPIHGVNGEFGMVSFVAPNEIQKNSKLPIARVVSDMSLVRDYAFESSLKFLYNNRKQQQHPSLTPRELECLKWVAEGKTSWEISRILSCAEVTVNFHVTNTKRKLNVATRQQAAARAISLGLINPI